MWVVIQINDTLVGERNGKSKLPDDMTDSIGHQLRQHFDDIDPDVIVGVSLSNGIGHNLQIITIAGFQIYILYNSNRISVRSKMAQIFADAYLNARFYA